MIFRAVDCSRDARPVPSQQIGASQDSHDRIGLCGCRANFYGREGSPGGPDDTVKVPFVGIESTRVASY